MKRPSSSILWPVLAAVAVAVLLAGPARAQTATQSVTLSAGWNAVWLETEPVYATGANAGQPKAPQDVFTHAAIAVIATPKPLTGLSEFFGADPVGAGTLTPTLTYNQPEWQHWLRTPVVPNSLTTVFGNRPYLIQVDAGTATFVLPVTGKARFVRPTWTPDRYNLVGFGLEGDTTFDGFFGPAGTRHPVAKIFRLNADGSWVKTTTAPIRPMKPNEAYWVFSAGPSSYMGPVAVDFDHAVAGRLSFGGPSDAVATGADALALDLKEIIFTNLGTAAAVPELDLESVSAGPGTLALHVVRPATDGLGYTRGNQVDSAAGPGVSSALGESVASQKSAALTLGAKRTGTFGGGGRTNLYRLKTGTGGASFWLPVTALDSDLAAAAEALQPTTDPVAGLWVGEVIIDAATSIVENGEPVRPAAGSAPIRLLLHSGSGGGVRLLSQVTIMQTRTADPAVVPVPKLVVDPAKIPFFEGVKERNGKRVGLRLEAVAYDMPRDGSVAAQSESPVNPASDDLIDMIVAESISPVTKWYSGAGLYANRAAVNAAAIEAYLLFRDIRPSALKETYLLTVPAGGALGAGGSVQAALTLDPFHRSNPFRHAYHQGHPKGPQITRAMTITFDPGQAVTDRLRGTFHETIAGLTKTNLELTGRIELRRVSTVETLE